MSADAFRLFVFVRHAESEANTAHVLSSDPARPVALTAGYGHPELRSVSFRPACCRARRGQSGRAGAIGAASAGRLVPDFMCHE